MGAAPMTCDVGFMEIRQALTKSSEKEMLKW